MRRTAELLLVAVGVAVIAYGVGSCGKTDAVDAAEARARDAENGFRTAMAYAAQRQARVETVTVATVRQGARVDTVLVTVDSVLADTSADVPQLRRTLSMLRTEVVTYRVTVDSLLVAHRAYIVATDNALLMADSTIAALHAVIAAHERKRWKYVGQGFVGGLGTAALFILLL